MERSEKANLKTNSSVPDIVFYQLKLDREEEVIGFIDNDSEEHFGKLARKGGEILLPGVFPQKTKIAEDPAKLSQNQAKKSKVKVRVDLPNSDTELKTLLLYGNSSSAELKLVQDGKPKKTESGSEANTDKVENDEKALEVKTFHKSCTSNFSNDSQCSKSEDCDCCHRAPDEREGTAEEEEAGAEGPASCE